MTIKGRPPIYPFAKLEEGQYFCMPVETVKEASIRTAAYRASKKYGKRFSVTTKEKRIKVLCLGVQNE